MSDSLEGIKRIKAFEKFFLWLGKDKITIKDLENQKEHFTMLVTEKGILDFHKKLEGTIPQYESLGEVDLKDVFKDIQIPEFEKKFLEEIIAHLRQVNLDEQEYSHYAIVNTEIGDDV